MVDEKKKILIVEDEKAIATVFELKLAGAGFVAMSVGNGEDALALLAKDHFDLVLLDLVMPKMDGFAVLEEMKRRGLATPVIVLSNLNQEEDKKRAKDLGAREFFLKSDMPITDLVAYAETLW